MRRAGTAALTLALLLTGAASGSAQIFALESLDRFFRVEWEVTRDRKGPAVEGYVYNKAHRSAQRIRLQIDRVDGSGLVAGSSTVWLLGNIAIDDRGYFKASVAEASSYRVHVLSFDWICEGGGGM